MTLDQIDRMVRQANPVADPTILEPVEKSVLAKQRRMDMQTHNRVEVAKGPEGPRLGLFIGIAAAAAIVIGALLLLPRGSEAPVADQPTISPVEIATAFVEAYGNFDVDTAATLLSTDADLSRLDGGQENWRLGNRLLEAQGFKLLLDSCEESESLPASGTAVRCTWDFHAIRSDEIGLGPFSGSAFDLDVLDGQIVAVEVRWGIAEFSPQVWEPFAAWVGETYPEDVDAMYTAGFRDFRHTEESIALWGQRSREYVEMVNGQAVDTATAFVQAFGSFDVEGVADLLAPQANLSSFEWDGEDWLASNRLQEAQGFKLLLHSCDLVAVSPSSTIVSCSFDFHSLRSDEVGLGPFSGSSFDVSLEDGMVSRASINLNIDEFGVQMWGPFAEWLAETYPDDVAVMYTNAGQSLERLDEESIALWEQRTREYVEVVNG